MLKYCQRIQNAEAQKFTILVFKKLQMFYFFAPFFGCEMKKKKKKTFVNSALLNCVKMFVKLSESREIFSLFIFSSRNSFHKSLISFPREIHLFSRRKKEWKILRTFEFAYYFNFLYTYRLRVGILSEILPLSFSISRVFNKWKKKKKNQQECLMMKK